jgi:5-methylthioribose kinase
MLLIDELNAEDYLRQAGRLGAGERVTIAPLAGGVSNQVLYVARPERPGEDFVLKQARPQLRTPDPWFASVERVWREVDVLRICQEVLEREPTGLANASGSNASKTDTSLAGELRAVTPRILFEDRPQYIFAMSAAPRDHRVWKQDLLAGRVDPAIARACGRLLGQLHASTWLNLDTAQRIGDRKLFDELRIDPYYRALVRAYPDAQKDLQPLIEQVSSPGRSLVHADFSPKNLLVFADGLMMVDFETGHFGDPAFDLGFFLSHLVLKAFEAAPGHEPYLDLTTQFWAAYRDRVQPSVPDDEYCQLVKRAVQNFAGCAWARLDGTSKIDYLTDPRRREGARGLARGLLRAHGAGWDEVLMRVRTICQTWA